LFHSFQLHGSSLLASRTMPCIYFSLHGKILTPYYISRLWLLSSRNQITRDLARYNVDSFKLNYSSHDSLKGRLMPLPDSWHSGYIHTYTHTNYTVHKITPPNFWSYHRGYHRRYHARLPSLGCMFISSVFISSILHFL
jgi:hypothetical protein